MLTKKDLKQRFNIGHNTVYRTLQACPLSTKKKRYTEAEIEQYFLPARQMLAAGKTYKEVEQYFALNPSERADFLETENVKSFKPVIKEANDAINAATPIPSIAMKNPSSHDDNLSKRFRITYSTSRASARLAKASNRESVTSYSQMSSTIQIIHKLGGTILCIAELA